MYVRGIYGMFVVADGGGETSRSTSAYSEPYTMLVTARGI